MERRTYQRAQRRELLYTIARMLFIALLVAGAYFAFRYVSLRSIKEINEIVVREASPWYMTVDEPVRMTVVDDTGQLTMEITGEEVRMSADQKTALFIGAEATYYEDGEVSMTMTAGQIEYDTETEDFVLTDGLHINTREGMSVDGDKVIWRRAKGASGRMGAKIPSFMFPEGVTIAKKPKDENGHVIWDAVYDEFSVTADYMQADKEFYYLEMVGNATGQVSQLADTSFITERDLTDVETLKLEDFETLTFKTEKLIFDNENQVVLATSRFYDRSFKIIDPDGQEVKVEAYQENPQPVTFQKEEVTIECNHLEAHIEDQWASCYGDIEMLVPPAEPEEGDDRGLKVMKRQTTKIATNEVEYFWGRDFILTHSPTRVEQDDRLALAGKITYWGDERLVLLEDNITVVQGSGQWLVEEELIEVEDHDMERAVTSYTELYANRAVIYLNNNDFIASGNVMTRQDDRETAADTIVYQDDIKRITAKGNVKFRDKDGQTLLAGGLVYHNDSDFMEVTGGVSASIRLPAKYANDINSTLASVREEPEPEPITDPPVSAEAPARNPNLASQLASGLSPLPLPEPLPAASSDTGLPVLPIPGEAGSTATTGGGQEIILELGGEDLPDSDETSEDATNIAEEPAAPVTPPEEDQG